MLQAPIQTPDGMQAENARLRHELDRMRAEKVRLRSENRDLRSALDAHTLRAGSTALYGPLELTAGTCVGPRRRRRREPPTRGGDR